MSKKGIDAILDASQWYRSNRRHLDSSSNASARYFAERCQQNLLDAVSTEGELAANQHEMLRAGLCSIYNRLRDRDEFGRSHHFSSLTDIEWALESLIQRYEDSFNEED